MINVALASDANYLMQTIVTIESVINCSRKEDRYKFLLLLDSNIPREERRVFYEIPHNYNNCVVEIHDFKDRFLDAASPKGHITIPTYYRLILPELVDDSKCIYLDSDTVVRCDLHDLYYVDMGENYVAGVKGPAYCSMEKEKKHEYEKKSGIHDLSGYINAGVLLFNIDILKKNGFVNKALELSKEDFTNNDQDIINRLCEGKILHLPYSYNVQNHYIDYNSDKKMLYSVFGNDVVENAINSPKVVHFAYAQKPWEFCNIKYADYWWKIAKASMISERIEKEYELFKKYVRNEKCDSKLFEELEKYKNVYIYGAGKIAKRVIDKFLEKGIEINAVLVTDSEKEETDIMGVPITKYSGQLGNHDLVVIATNDNNMVPIRRKLIRDGVRNIIHTPWLFKN